MAVGSIGGKSSGILGFLRKANQEKETANERIASGNRINKAADDAAGLSIAEKLKALDSILAQGNRNASDAVSALSIQESALGQISDITIRQQELAFQAQNGTYSDEQRAALNAEYQELSQEIDRIAQTTEFNGRKLLNGEEFSAQVGTDSSANSQITVRGSQLDTSNLGDISTQAGAAQAASALNQITQSIQEARSDIGATESRIETAVRNNQATIEAQTAAEDMIRSADIATEVANRTSAGIRENAAVAIQAQAGKLNGANISKLLTGP